MKTSESILTIAKALPKAQAAMKAAKKDTENTFFKSKYSDLASVIDACKEALNANGISFLQAVRSTESGVTVETMLLHESGEWISEELALPVSKHDAQSLGSAISYGKRYGLQGLVGVPSEDDDGNNAAKPKEVSALQVAGAGPSESETIYAAMTAEDRAFCDGEARKLIEAADKMKPGDLGAFYNLQGYSDNHMMAINWALRGNASVRRKIKDGRHAVRINDLATNMTSGVASQP